MKKSDSMQGDKQPAPKTTDNQKEIASRWHGHEDDGSSGCYHYDFHGDKPPEESPEK